MQDYRFFDVTVLQRIPLSPSLQRFVLSGEGLQWIQPVAPDLYLKIFFPPAGSGAVSVPRGEDWYARYLAQAPAERSPMRTFTVRCLDPARKAVVIDFALHGDQGPASRWARQARIGDALVLYAPLLARWGRGFAWRLPAQLRRVVLVADECALPAAAAIIESLARMAAPPSTIALLEVPERGDQLPLNPGPHIEVQWYPRQHEGGCKAYGEALLTALAYQFEARGKLATPDAGVADGGEPLWDLAEADTAACYVWIAVETALAAQLRRYVIAAGIPRSWISCMGYWRQGRPQH